MGAFLTIILLIFLAAYLGINLTKLGADAIDTMMDIEDYRRQKRDDKWRK